MLPFFFRFLLFDLQLFRFFFFLFSRTAANSFLHQKTETRSLPVVEHVCYRLACTGTLPGIQWDRSDDVPRSLLGPERVPVLRQGELKFTDDKVHLPTVAMRYFPSMEFELGGGRRPELARLIPNV